MYELLTDKEIMMIRKRIEWYGRIDEEQVNPDVEYVLREWDKRKSEYLLKMFGNQLILTKDVHYRKGLDEMCDEIEKMWWSSSPAYAFLSTFRTALVHPANFLMDKVSDGLWADTYPEMRNAFSILVNSNSLATNIYNGETCEIPLENGKKLKINKGCKVSKMLGKISKELHIAENEFEAFRIQLSQIHNQKELKGKLSISIHPLDFITMSDNDCGWDSCMSWEQPGCYRQGTVEMMNSPMVVVAYLHATNDMILGRDENSEPLTWNNKKWRELFVVNKDIITNVKGYPYCNEFLSAEVLTWLKELAEKTSYGNYEEAIHKYSTNDWRHEESDKYINQRRIVIETSTDMMYNDFGSEQYCYLSTEIKDDQTIYFNYSGANECMCCGALHPYFPDADEVERFLCCENCEGVYRYCEECGNRVDEDAVYWVDDACLCEWCFSEKAQYSEIDGEDHLNCNMIDVYIGNEEGNNFYENSSIPVYEGLINWFSPCLDNITSDRTVIKTLRPENAWRYYTFIPVQYITDGFARIAGYDSAEEMIKELVRPDNLYFDPHVKVDIL